MTHFTKDNDELLINLIRCNPILFDASDKNYKNNILKHRTWESISETMKIEVSDIKKRWKHLRDHYMKKKKAASSTGQAKNDNNTWEYMSQLTFLSQAPSQRQTLTNAESEIQMNEEQNESECQENTAQNTSHDNVYLDLDKNMTVDSPQKTDDSFVEPSIKKRKKTNENDLVSVLKHRQEERARVFDKLLTEPKKSPIHKFFESMADIVCEFPPPLVAEARLKVCQMVNELEIKKSGSFSLTPMPPGYDSSDSWPY